MKQFSQRRNYAWLVCLMISLAIPLLPIPQTAIALDRDRLTAEAFSSAQWILATSASRAVAQVGARLAAGDDLLGETIRKRQDLETALSVAWNAANNSDIDPEARSLAQTEIRRITAEIDDLDTDIAQQFPNYAELANPRPVGLTELQRILGANESMLLFLVDRNATYIWAVSSDNFGWAKVEISRLELEDRIRQLRRTLDPHAATRGFASDDDSTGSDLKFDLDIARELYDRLISPIEQIISSSSLVWTVLDGPLESLPFSVLARGQGDPRPKSIFEIDWLARDYAFATLTSVSSLRRRKESSPIHREMTFLGFGDPVLGVETKQPEQVASRGISTFFKGARADLDAIRSLDPLPGTRRELSAIQNVLGSARARIILGPEATETHVKSAPLQDYSVLAFATHGLITGELDGLSEPALVMTPPKQATVIDDGLLTASEISAMELDAEWVILSACNTAASDGTPGATGLSGLARAFLYAGARSILVSHWPVQDDAAALLTVRTLEALSNDHGTSRPEALRRAMLSLIDSDDPRLAHPSAWAPFVIVGG